MELAVTGGGGFLGAHLVREALAQGHGVRVLVRSTTPGPDLVGLPLRVFSGDLTREPVPDGFFRGADVVFHLAALYAEGPDALPALREANVGGTAAVLDGARRGGVGRVVHCSTAGTCVPPGVDRPVTEKDRADPSRTSPYHVSKWEAEQLALGSNGIDVVVVCPAAPVGAYDRRPTVTGRRIRDVVEGRWPRLLAGPVNHLPARDAARGMLLAAARGRPGERYLLGGEDLPPEEFLARASAAAKVPVPIRPWTWRLRGKGRPTPGALPVDDGKARRELGYTSGDLDQAFREAAAWFRSVRPGI